MKHKGESKEKLAKKYNLTHKTVIMKQLEDCTMVHIKVLHGTSFWNSTSSGSLIE